MWSNRVKADGNECGAYNAPVAQAKRCLAGRSRPTGGVPRVVPLDELFFLSSEKSDMRAIDQHVLGGLASSALSVLKIPAEQASKD